MSDQDHAQLERLHGRLRQLAAEPEAEGDQALALRCCGLALEALRLGNYGVGALLVDAQDRVLAEAGNRVFSPAFDSAGHAEMGVLDAFEARYPDYPDRGALTLWVSLEPCPMCLVRALLSGVGRVRYLASDTEGGMVSHLRHLPPAWRNLATLQRHEQAAPHSAITELAAELARSHLPALRQRLLSAIRG